MKNALALILGGLTLLSGCATAAPKKTTAYISIDETFPIFNLQKPGNPGNVKIPTTTDQLARWKAAAAAYQQAQKEIADAVDHYEPLALKKKKAEAKKP